MNWQIFGASVALLLIFEGFLPAVAPDLWRKLLLQISQVSDAAIQKIALVIVIVGVLLLFVFLRI